MSQPGKTCGCGANGKRAAGNPCKPKLQTGNELGFRRDTGSSGCGKTIGCGCIKVPAQKTVPQKTNVKPDK